MSENTGRITAADRAEAKFSGLTVAECAEVLGRSSSHVRNLIRSGALEAVDLSIPGSKRADYAVDRKALVEFIESRTVKGEAAA